MLQSSNLLVHFNPEKELILACDALPYGLGAVLLHRMEDSSERPSAFASHTLAPAEQRYAQLDKEDSEMGLDAKWLYLLHSVQGRKTARQC